MTIAIPISQERISPLLDAAARLLLVTCQRGKEVARKEFILNPQPPEELARSVAELRVDVLLCAALSRTYSGNWSGVACAFCRISAAKPTPCCKLFAVTGSTGLNSGCRAAGNHICPAVVADAGTWRETASPAGKKIQPPTCQKLQSKSTRSTYEPVAN